MAYRVLVLLLGLMTAALTQADDELHYKLVSFQVSVEREVANDQMQVSLKVEHEATSAKDAADRVNRDMQWALGIAKSYDSVRVSTRNYSTRPRYDKRHIIGWYASQQLFLEGESFEQVSELVTRLQEKLQVESMAFVPTAKTRKATEDELVVEALQAFTARAVIVTETMKAAAYEVVDIHVGSQGHYPPMARMRAGAAAMEGFGVSDVAIDAGTSKVVVTANGRVQLR
jgi:predicted secreted protein